MSSLHLIKQKYQKMNSSGLTTEDQTKHRRNNVGTMDNSTHLNDIILEDIQENPKHKANSNGFCILKMAHTEPSASNVCNTTYAMSTDDGNQSSANLKSFSLNERKGRILSHWKYFVQNIDPIPLLEELDKQGLLAKKDFDANNKKQRSHQVSLILLKVYTSIQQEDDFVKFQQSVQQISVPCAKRLDEHVSPLSVKVDDIAADKYRNILTYHRLELETKLHSSDFLDIVNDFVEAFIFSIDDVKTVVYAYPNREASYLFLDLVVSKLKENTFDCLIKSIANPNRVRRFKHFLNEVNKSTTLETPERLVTAEVTGEKVLSPLGDNDFIKITHEDITDGLKNIRKNIDVTWMPAKTKEISKGSIIIDLSLLDCTLNDSLDTKRITKYIKKMLERMYSDKAFQDSMNTDPFVKVTVNITGKERSTAVQQMNEVDLLAVNKSFLIEEIDTRTLTKAFKRKGIHCFDSIGLDTNTERRHKAEMFVAELQTMNLTNQLLQILEEESMFHVLERLKTCRKAYSSYTPEIMNNIFLNMEDIVEQLECDTLRNTFVERNVFSENFFDDLENMFHDNEEQLKKEIVIEILSSGPFAMMTLLDVLYINKLDRLADNIINNEINDDIPVELQSDRQQGKRLILTFDMKLEDPDASFNWENFQELNTLLEDLEESLLMWISTTNKVITELKNLATNLNEHFRNINIAKVSGSAAAISGGILTIIGLALIPVTFGGSLGLSIAGGALAAAGGTTAGGSMMVDVVLSGNTCREAEDLLRTHASSVQNVKQKCIAIGLILKKLGEIDQCFPEWVTFWATVVGLSQQKKNVKWCTVTDIILNLTAATLTVGFIAGGAALRFSRAGVSAGGASLRIGGAAAGLGLHIAGGALGLVLVPLDIFTLVDSAIDIHKKNPNKVGANISSLADILQQQCPTREESVYMIKRTKSMSQYILKNIKGFGFDM